MTDGIDAPTNHQHPGAAAGAADAADTSDPADTDRGYRSLPLRRMAAVTAGIGLLITLIALATLTLLQNAPAQYFDDIHTVFWHFDVGREHNVATWYSAGLWLLLAVASIAIALARPQRPRSWWFIAVVATLASADEYLELHERLDGPAQSLATALPFDLWFTWVLVGLPIAVVVAAVLLRAVLSLPAASRLGIVVAGTLFVLGAVGVETVNGSILERNDGIVTNAYLYGTMVEEVLEMAAVGLALASVLALVQHRRSDGTLRLDPRVAAR
ncbi:hypothetical protein [Serinibacter arcticus]|uniref:hypothetical protein n=1 Tax=Serinibacter arcticus TaxID=1655435 RepID=UPI001092E8E6|nr:hypothetical protein [Serinibacter arcticus]